MKRDPRRFAPLGLVLSGLGLLTIITILILRGFSAVGLFTPPDSDLLDRILYVAITIFVVGFAVYALLDPDRVRKFMTGRQAQYGSNALILLVAFTGILIAANVLVYQNPANWDLEFDVTEDKQNTLAPETQQTLDSLPEPVLATAFYSVRLPRNTVQQLFEDYKTNSGGKFDYQFIDPDANPVLVNELGITGDGKILLQMGENSEIVTFASESELTNGLVRLMNPEQPVIYFLTGEGEHDLETAGEGGYSRVRQVLERKNYIVETVNLQAQNAIPENARALVIAGPLAPLSESTLSIIQGYLQDGGSLLALVNPRPITELEDRPDLLVEYLAEDWGIQLNDDIVIDTNSPSTPYYAVGAQYAAHPITEKMQGIAAIFPYSRSITLDTSNVEVFPTPLIFTINNSWGETDYEALANQELSFDESADLIGPLTLAAAAENSGTGSRVVVFGGSTFAQDDSFDFSGNGDMFVNSVDWIAEQESLIGLTEQETIERTFNPPGSLQFILLMLGTLCVIPLAIIGAGTYAWIQRRRRG